MPDLLLRARRWLLDCAGGSRTVLAIYVAMNSIVAVNAVLHDPRVGYDAGHHLAYVRTLAEKGRLPGNDETKEFYHPPLPYLLPAAALRLVEPLLSQDRRWVATGIAAKVGQFANLAASLILGLALLRCCSIARPGNSAFAATALGLVAIVPAYYRTFAFLRGDPYLVCFSALTLYGFARVISGDGSARATLRLGISLAGALFSRIVAVLLVPPLLVVAGLRALAPDRDARRLAMTLALGTALGLVIGGPILYARTAGEASTPISRIGAPVDAAPALEGENSSADTLFTAPLRPSLGRDAFRIFYADTWGDYWRYFVARDDAVGAYLGRVNVLALLPSAVFLGAFCIGAVRLFAFVRRPSSDAQSAVTALCFLVVALNGAAFVWVLMSLPPPPAPGGPLHLWEVEDSVKPTYVLQALPCLAFLGAEALETVRSRSAILHRGVCVALLLVALHNLGACVTRFPLRFGPGTY